MEGNDTKFGIFVREKKHIKLIKAASVDIYGVASKSAQSETALQSLDSEPGVQLEGLESGIVDSSPSTGSVMEGVIMSELGGYKLQNCNFIPILTEPTIYYHIVSKRTTGSSNSSGTQEILANNGDLKEKKIDRETYGKVEMSDGGTLTVYVRQDIPGLRMLNKLAQYNGYGRGYYKVISIKSAEVSLVNYVAKKKKFFPDDFSLIVYIGKEYSKLVFMQGRKLKHIGSTLDIGTSNLHTYDVYFSKILLEMENGGIPTLDNIIVCGEDVSENLILSFYGTFPETNVSRIEFDEIDVGDLSDEQRSKISAFTLPIAVATEYYEEQAKEYVGLNLLPRYVKEGQKFFQFAWHGYALVPLLFAAVFFVTYQILVNRDSLKKLDKNIELQTELRNQNLQILSKIEEINVRISGFDQTQKILDSVAVGSEVWDKYLSQIAGFASTKKNYWVRSLMKDDIKTAKMEGHALDRNVLTELTANIDSAILKSIIYDPIRNKSAFRFAITFKFQK
jgi:hypothetical protein